MDEAALAITAAARGVSALGRDPFSFLSTAEETNRVQDRLYFCCSLYRHRLLPSLLSKRRAIQTSPSLNEKY